VRVYGSKNASFKPAYSLRPNIVGRIFNKGAWRVSLPAGKTFGDLDWVGIWCANALAVVLSSGPEYEGQRAEQRRHDDRQTMA
jgi:hypothetical protein